MSAITWFYLILAVVTVAAFVLPRWSVKQGDTGLVQFQFICMATIAFVSLCVLVEATHSLPEVLSLSGGLVAFTVLSSFDSGRILWLTHRAKHAA